MRILLVRHAEAVPETAGLDDAARWLSEQGRVQARDVAEQVRERLPEPLRESGLYCLTSPRVRTVQTAELFAQRLNFLGMVESLPSLSYTVPAERAVRDLTRHGGQDLAAFGHMPTVAEIAARLTHQQHVGPLSLCEALWIEDGRVVWSAKPR
jgi:phosphohistidine phosphatase SixA